MSDFHVWILESFSSLMGNHQTTSQQNINIKVLSLKLYEDIDRLYVKYGRVLNKLRTYRLFLFNYVTEKYLWNKDTSVSDRKTLQGSSIVLFHCCI